MEIFLWSNYWKKRQKHYGFWWLGKLIDCLVLTRSRFVPDELEVSEKLLAPNICIQNFGKLLATSQYFATKKQNKHIKPPARHAKAQRRVSAHCSKQWLWMEWFFCVFLSTLQWHSAYFLQVRLLATKRSCIATYKRALWKFPKWMIDFFLFHITMFLKLLVGISLGKHQIS